MQTEVALAREMYVPVLYVVIKADSTPHALPPGARQTHQGASMHVGRGWFEALGNPVTSCYHYYVNNASHIRRVQRHCCRLLEVVATSPALHGYVTGLQFYGHFHAYVLCFKWSYTLCNSLLEDISKLIIWSPRGVTIWAVGGTNSCSLGKHSSFIAFAMLWLSCSAGNKPSALVRRQ